MAGVIPTALALPFSVVDVGKIEGYSDRRDRRLLSGIELVCDSIAGPLRSLSSILDIMSSSCGAREKGRTAITAGDLAFLKALYYRNTALGGSLSKAADRRQYDAPVQASLGASSSHSISYPSISAPMIQSRTASVRPDAPSSRHRGPRKDELPPASGQAWSERVGPRPRIGFAVPEARSEDRWCPGGIEAAKSVKASRAASTSRSR